ncbi:hypothetical protein ABT187_33320 [Streptomyces sp. NPDC001817]|uniref:hypothetical protein n=1 Tax=Streptomyces sp. NPDC001817 TaxID=3154398 RepID=UPI003320FD90
MQQGTETHRKETSPERWCVRLEDVNGDQDQDQDNVWYRVDRHEQGVLRHQHQRRPRPAGSSSASSTRSARKPREVKQVAQPWREKGRPELTTPTVEEQLNADVTALMDAG